MAWLDKSHNGYKVFEETIKTYSHSVAKNYTSEFSIPPNTDFWVIANYNGTNLSTSCHVEMFYSDVPSGTFRARPKTSGFYFNATSALIDNATKIIPQDISTVKAYPRYKMKVTGAAATTQGGGLVKFVIMYQSGQEW